MDIISVAGPSFIEVEGETPDDPNLVKIRFVKRDPETRIGVGKRLLQGAIEAVPDDCKHGWGWVHWWGNPGMMPPCKVVKIDGVWYKRKSCEGVVIDEH